MHYVVLNAVELPLNVFLMYNHMIHSIFDFAHFIVQILIPLWES